MSTTNESGRRCALVSGASRGIGRAVVDALLAGGWRVVAGVRDVASARESFGDVEGLVVVHMDVTDPDQIRDGVAAANAFAGGALSAVVVNAGYALMGAVEDVEMDAVHDVFATNTFGALAVVQQALPAMREAGGGTIVFVSTVGAELPTPLLGAYRASKAALNAFAEVLSMEVRPFGIRVGRVEPGMVATEFSMATRRSGSVTTPDGPYTPLAVELRDAMGRWRERFQSTSEEVADQILRIIEAPAPPPVVLVGEDAHQLHGRTEDGVLEFLGVEWPRPS